MSRLSTIGCFLAFLFLSGTVDAASVVKAACPGQSVTVVTWGVDHKTKTTTVTACNGTVTKTVATIQPISAVIWAADHITKTTTLTYGDGTVTRTVATVQPTSAVTWAADHITKTTALTYGDGTVTRSVTTVQPTSVITWATDHITKTTTLTYGDGTVSRSSVVVQPTTTGGVYTAPVYASDWAQSGLVTKPSVSLLSNVYGDGTTAQIGAGTASLPFDQAALVARSITDPNAVVKSPSSVAYDLTWGTPDRMGPSYAAMFASGAYTFPTSFTMMGHTISGQCVNGPANGGCANGLILAAPISDVIDAYNQGWTGKNVNVLMFDQYNWSIGSGVAGGDSHGITTMFIAQRYAMGAKLLGLDYSINLITGKPLGTIRDFSGSVAAGASMHVINMSFGTNYWSIVGRSGSSISQSDITYVANATRSYVAAINNIIDGTTPTTGFNFGDAVVVKAAGNDSIAANLENYANALSANAKVSPRLLIVGALTQAGAVSNPVSMASYSNYAGTTTLVQNRFLVASGTVPFVDGALAVDGYAVSSTGNEGTSYAAPRVAGYVAVVRQKFPNLTGARTADLLLATARYDTLSCYPSCSKAIYGQGEASLTRALAPVGLLK